MATQLQLKWEVKQRLTLIESTVVWEGRLTTKDLMDNFGISRPQASKDLTLYQQLCPDNLFYDRSLKCYVTTKAFKPLFIKGTPDEYLDLLRVSGSEESSGTVITLAQKLPVVEVLAPPQRSLDFATLHAVSRAIRQQHKIRTTYQSLSSPEPKDVILSPHTLVFNGYRWHVRAYSDTHHDFRDFLLSRIRSVPAVVGTIKIREAEDKKWNSFIDLKIIPNSSLSNSQKQVIIEDYDMHNGKLEIKIRAALINYYLRLLHIDPNSKALQNSQLTVLNKKDDFL